MSFSLLVVPSLTSALWTLTTLKRGQGWGRGNNRLPSGFAETEGRAWRKAEFSDSNSCERKNHGERERVANVRCVSAPLHFLLYFMFTVVK